MLVVAQALGLIASGALLIANVRLGGLLLTAVMLSVILTKDNPMLARSDQAWRHNLMNGLKDAAVSGIGILIFNRRLQIRHRKQHVNEQQYAPVRAPAEA